MATSTPENTGTATAAPEASSSMTPGVIGSWIAVAIAAGLVVLSSRRFKRSGGRIWTFHAIYFAVAIVLVIAVPPSVDRIVFSSAGVAVAGLIFPIMESLRAVCTPASADDMEWLQYWAEAGLVMFITAYLKDYKLASEQFQLYWYQCEVFFFVWLYLPFTDGATLCFDFITKPIFSPIIDPLTAKLNSYLTGLVMTIINASHLWALWAFFVILPKGLKRFATITVGTAFPLMASVTAVSTKDTADDTFWLTYWSCYGVLFLIMDFLETWLGQIWGFYSLVLFSTVYLMLPMTQGAEKVFRHVLVPLAGLQESLLIRDAVMLKKQLLAQFPADRQIELRKLITSTFDVENADGDVDDKAGDDRMEISAANAKKFWNDSPWNRNFLKRRTQREASGPPGETTPLV